MKYGGGVRIGSSDRGLRAGLPLPLLAGGGGVQGGGVRMGTGGGVRMGTSVTEVDELVVMDGSVKEARLMKQSSGGKETETSKTLDITVLVVLLALLGPMTVDEANSLVISISCICHLRKIFILEPW